MANLKPYSRPAIRVQQEFVPLAQSVIQPQYACVVGAEKQVLEYTDPSDRSNITYGAYVPGADTSYDYLALPVGGIVEKDGVRLFMESVLAQYAEIATADVLEYSSANQIKFHSGTGYFTTFNNGVTTFSRHAAFMNRDVAVGDRLHITGAGGSMSTRVTGLIHDIIGASVDSPTSGSGNHTARGANCVVTTAIVNSGGQSLTVDTGTNAFVGNLSKGYIRDTYLITCITAGNGGDTARFSVTSAKGDNQSSISVGALDAAFAVGTRGLRVKFESGSDDNAYAVGDQFRIVADAHYIVPVPTTAGTYDGDHDTVYKVEVVKGGLWSENVQVIVTTNNGIDQGGPIVVAYNTSFALGNLGATMKFPTDTSAAQNGLLLGETYYVVATAAKQGGVSKITIANPIPSNIESTPGEDLNVKFYIYKDSVEIPVRGYPNSVPTVVADDESFTVSSAIAITDASWKDNNGITLLPIPVASANVFVTYTALKVEQAGILRSLSDLSAVPSVLGKKVAANPLSYGVDKVLANSAGQPCYFISVATEDLNGFTEALAALESSRDSYFKVPLSSDRAIQDLFEAHVTALSGSEGGIASSPTGNWCYALVSSDVSDVVVKYGKKQDGSNWTGYVSNYLGADPARYRLVTIPGATLLDDGIRAGDVFKTSFALDAFGNSTVKSAKIASVIDQENLLLVSPGLSSAVGASDSLQQIQIVRSLTNDEYALAAAYNSQSFSSRRVSPVYPHFSLNVEKYFVACAVAGLASSVAPHQPITNFSIVGFEDQIGFASKKLTPTQLDVIASGGTLIAMRDSANGAIYVRHQLTSDMTDSLHSELSVTRNYDSVSRYFFDLFSAFIGKNNLHENFLQLLDVMFRNGLNYLSGDATSTPSAGPQIITYDEKTLSVVQNPLNRTEVDFGADITLPEPGNNFNFKFRAKA